MEELNVNFTMGENEPLVANFEAFNEPPTIELLNTNYELLENKPLINDVELVGNKTADELGLATEQQLTDGLATKQNKGNYALKSELPTVPTLVSELENDSNYATQTQVLQAIAAIPQFSLSIVDELPLAGEKMTLYLVPKEGTNNDVYDEYIWIEQTSSYEHLGTTAVDLTDYVKKTDYAGTDGSAGLIKTSSTYGTQMVTAGYIRAGVDTLESYNTRGVNLFISKGTLDNVLTQYSKTVLTTQADYDALETKDENTLYLIEE